jgi:hypothetical protein
MYLILGLLYYLFPLIVIGIVIALVTRKKDPNQPPVPPKPLIFPSNFIILLTIIVVGFNILAYETRIGIGYGVYLALILAGLLMTIPREKRTTVVYLTALVGAVAGLLLGFRANGFVQFINAAIAGASIFLLTIYVILGFFNWNGLWWLKILWQLCLNGFANIFRLIKAPSQNSSLSKPFFTSALKTTVLTLIVVIIFANILSQADPVFSQLIENFMDEIVPRAIISILLAFLTALVTTIAIEAKELKESRLSIFSFQDLLITV